jgi:UDP-N-acetylglucosamine--N-acetylmuramyl-(pentapeptide) pyrophosphoryl-undecaprenol N-acetylglucosamine transferase
LPDRIVLTGGGTAGHVTPNLALIPRFKKAGWEVHYIGSHDGIERELAGSLPGVAYHAIRSGKLRRYFSFRNLTDPFRVTAGVFEAASILRRLRPRIVFSKGGFVSVPVVAGGWLAHVPVVIHESDLTPGLANRLSIPLARTVCTTFPETAAAIGSKGLHTGPPIRPELLAGSRWTAYCPDSRGISRSRISGARAISMQGLGTDRSTGSMSTWATSCPTYWPARTWF